jgi:hypothetical protein
MKKIFFFLFFTFCFVFKNYSQSVAINTTGASANTSSLLDISTSTKGILIPRMTLVERDAITTPANGLLIYQTNNIIGFYFYNGTAWRLVGNESQLEKITEGANTGYRILGRDTANHGNIGNRGMDLSYSGSASLTRGATGLNSFAANESTTASHFCTAAFGFETVASDQCNFATGRRSKAIGFLSSAFGENTVATGVLTTTFGDSTFARSRCEMTVGSFNTDYTPAHVGIINPLDRVFGVGIGTLGNRRDGLIVYKSGTIWLDTLISNPIVTANRLYVLNKKLHYNGEKLSPSELEKITEGGNTGWRILGRNAANYGDIGAGAIDFSFAPSSSSILGATGLGSFATGGNTIASGNYSTSIGGGSTASGLYAFAGGSSSIAAGSNSFSIGEQTIANAYSEIALGSYNTNYTALNATGFDALDRAFVIGIGSSESTRKDALVTFKNGNTFISNSGGTPVNGSTSIIPNNGVAALQIRATADGINLLAGTNNINMTIAKQSIPNTGAPTYLSFGYMNAGVYVNTGRIDPAAAGTQVMYATTSDMRLKTDKGLYTDGLFTLNKIKIHNYNWKENSTADIGVFAQELYKIYPNAVSKGDDENTNTVKDKWMVDYSKLVPVLIAAIQQVNKENEEQKITIENLIKRIEKLEQKN